MRKNRRPRTARRGDGKSGLYCCSLFVLTRHAGRRVWGLSSHADQPPVSSNQRLFERHQPDASRGEAQFESLERAGEAPPSIHHGYRVTWVPSKYLHVVWWNRGLTSRGQCRGEWSVACAFVPEPLIGSLPATSDISACINNGDSSSVKSLLLTFHRPLGGAAFMRVKANLC